jgi:polyhydroxyalkanoate synthase subunit PhaC
MNDRPATSVAPCEAAPLPPLPPLSALIAWQQWGLQLGAAPHKQAQLAALAFRHWFTLADATTRSALAGLMVTDAASARDPGASAPAAAAPADRRFAGAQWQRWPFNLFALGHTLQQQWWRDATSDVPGLSPRTEGLVGLAAREWLQALSPANFPVTNPEVQAATLAERGANFRRGAAHLFDDVERALTGAPPAGAEAFVVGETVATARGKVIYRNRLIELIQYSPATAQVYAQPVLIVPDWMMKYYILDLSPENSLVAWLVARGHTVYMVSWHNPDGGDRSLSLDDYRVLGIEAALAAVTAVQPGQPIHAVGRCLGGTLLAIAAAARAGAARARTSLEAGGTGELASLTLLAAQTDFEQPGELALFVDDAQLVWLEQSTARTGCLDTRAMAAAFSLMRSGELFWGRMVREYLLGRRTPMIDLMAWHADRTRMPARMHAQYLRGLYLNNDLARGRLLAGGVPVSLADIALPVFMVATTTDQVAPWQSVYQLHRLTATEITLVLTPGGHDDGVVDPPAADGNHSRRAFRMATRAAGAPAMTPEAWAQQAQSIDGSWWTAWQHWLAPRSGERCAPPPPGTDGLDYGRAPGWYVRER